MGIYGPSTGSYGSYSSRSTPKLQTTVKLSTRLLEGKPVYDSRTGKVEINTPWLTYEQRFGGSMGSAGRAVYNRARGQSTSRTVTSKQWRKEEGVREKDYQVWKKANKESGIGGILGMVVGTTKRVLKDPSRAFTGVDPISTKLGNLVFGTNKTPIVNMMGGPSESSYQIREEETGRKASKTTRGFFKMADMIAGIWGGGAAAAAVGGAAGTAAGAGTLAGDIAAAAASGAVKGAVGAAVQTGGEDLTAVGKGALGGAVTGSIKGLTGFYMGGASGATSAGAGGAATSAGKDMSLWDTIGDYYTTDDGYNWGNIAGTALKAYGAYSSYKGGKAQQETARQSAALGREAYEFSRDQQAQQFQMGQTSLLERMQQRRDINMERGTIRDELRGYLGQGMNSRSRQMQGALLGLGTSGQNAAAMANFQKTPGYQFRMEEMMRGAERGLAGVGGSRSGRAAIELQQRAGGLAGQYFDNYINQLGSRSQQGIGALSQFGQMQAGLVPRADMFNSQFGQLNPGMASAAMTGMNQLGQAQLNFGGGMGSILSQFGGSLLNSGGGTSGYPNSTQYNDNLSMADLNYYGGR